VYLHNIDGISTQDCPGIYASESTELESNTSAASEQLHIYVRHSRKYAPSLARTRAFPMRSLTQSRFHHTKVNARRNHPCLNTSKNARILTHTKTYIQALLKHASTYDVGLVRKLARPLSYSEACVHNRKIDLTYTCTDAYMDTSFNKRIITNRLSHTHACKHVLLHELTIAA
jgi:hypothetical protein